MPSKRDWHAPSGMVDLLPDNEATWRHLRSVIERRAVSQGMGRIETPLVEDAAVFNQIGETTDLVEKGFYEVRQRVQLNGSAEESYILRPEGTTAIMRAYLEHEMQSWPQPVRLWHMGPMFRHEDLSIGRLRQFWHAGFEILGDADPATDALLIHLFWQILGDLNLRDGVVVDINSVGDASCRTKYRKTLTSYYQTVKDKLCPSCQSKLDKNPLRLLDCTEPDCQELKADAPQMFDFLCLSCREHLQVVLESLDELGVVYNLEPTLVRGLDYYARTTFEVRFTNDTNRERVLGGGGRYDNLMERFGGKSLPAVGFAIGLDRLVAAMHERELAVPALAGPDVVIVQLGERAKRASFHLLARLTDHGLAVMCQPSKENLKGQLLLAEKAGIRFALIIGQREALDETVILRDMLESAQETILQKDVVNILTQRLRSPGEPADN